MAKDITREELLQELCNAVIGDAPPIEPGDIALSEIAARTGTKRETVERRLLKNMPKGYEIVWRMINNHRGKCLHKV